jgi:signal transduction histidine kinase
MEESLDAIETAVAAATSLIEELLDVARLRAGQPLELRWGTVDLVALAAASAAEARTSHPGREAPVAAEVATLLGAWDEARLRRVQADLLGTAVKDSPEGGEVVVRVGQEEDAAGAWAVVAVQDRGVGIPASDLSRIFERFQRGGNVAAIGGTGIGVAGAKQIVAQHGGTIAIVSVEGQGSTFTVRLPLA